MDRPSLLARVVQREYGHNFPESVQLSSQSIPLRVVRSSRARRYLLRLNHDRSAQLTIPRRGSIEEARGFLQRNLNWLERAAERLAARPAVPQEWVVGTEILWRGERVRIEMARDQSPGWIAFGSEMLPVANMQGDLRGEIERHIQAIAIRDLPARVLELARQHGLTVRRVTIRSQRSRWGSCSQRATLSLNWRILHAPEFVRDYLILHELMHLREMNHSSRFWKEVESVCPEYEDAERWLKAHSHLLR